MNGLWLSGVLPASHCFARVFSQRARRAVRLCALDTRADHELHSERNPGREGCTRVENRRGLVNAQRLRQNLKLRRCHRRLRDEQRSDDDDGDDNRRFNEHLTGIILFHFSLRRFYASVRDARGERARNKNARR